MSPDRRAGQVLAAVVHNLYHVRLVFFHRRVDQGSDLLNLRYSEGSHRGTLKCYAGQNSFHNSVNL